MKKLIYKYKHLPIQIRASFWYLICNFLQKGISVLTTPVFTRVLSTTEYGQFSVFNSWNSILTIIVTLNLGSGVFVQALVKFEDERDKYASSMQGLEVTLCTAWTAIYLLFYNFWNSIFQLTTIQMVAMILIMWSSAAFGFWATVQRIDYQYKIFVIITIVTSVIKPFVEIIFVLQAEDKVTARIIAMLVTNLLAYTGFFVIQLRKGKTFYNKKYWRYAIRFNIPLLPHYLSAVVLASMDRIMISKMVNSTSAGIYTLAYSISQIMSLFNTALLATIDPWIYKKIKAKEIEDIKRVAYPSFIIIAFMNILVILFAPEAVALFAPKEYYEAIWVIPPVAMSVYFTFMYTFFAAFEFYYEKQFFVAIATSVGAILNIYLNWICINRFGYMAAGYTTLICYILFAIVHYCFMHRICRKFLCNKQPYNLKIIFVISLCFMAIGFGMLLTYHNKVIRYGMITILVFTAFLFKNRLIKIAKNIISLQEK